MGGDLVLTLLCVIFAVASGHGSYGSVYGYGGKQSYGGSGGYGSGGGQGSGGDGKDGRNHLWAVKVFHVAMIAKNGFKRELEKATRICLYPRKFRTCQLGCGHAATKTAPFHLFIILSPSLLAYDANLLDA